MSIPKDRQCFGSLSEDDQKRAADADLGNTLFMLDNRLRCLDCGSMVGAEKSAKGDSYVPSPRPHEKPMNRPEPPRKRNPFPK